MADNTRQFRYIVTIQGGLAALFADRPDVFVAGDLLWYPMEGNNQIRAAPDAMVVFGRPPGDRGSYQQWKEGGLAPQVVFEVLSPGNTVAEMTRKFRFYERHGVEEYYVYDPDRGSLDGWVRRGENLEDVSDMEGWVSPRLRVRFSLEGHDLVLYRPDGRRFETFLELEQRAEAERRQAQVERQRAEAEQQRAEAERQRAEAERQRAEAERRQAQVEQQRAEAERQRAEAERQRAERLAERLRALGVDPDVLDTD
ncbi:MAG: Uma2 family endonuclease [Candidatus Contendobacter sp.]|nr:Uma2 family endonuclease [Candidatus Contendobacter sp.]MDG4555929.1 Uma2 family endonuclease [Candidatus Contendobacter sp.]